MTQYRIKAVQEAVYRPEDGEPFAAAWGPEGWTVWCRTPIEQSKPVSKAKKKPIKQ